jgi:hypothetical protein
MDETIRQSQEIPGQLPPLTGEEVLDRLIRNVIRPKWVEVKADSDYLLD